MTAISNHIIENDAHKEAKPYIWRGPVLSELPISNAKFEEKPLNLTDVRALAEEDKPKVDTHGFCFVNHKSKTVADVHNDNDAAPYVDEMADFLKEFLGVETVIGFNARVRCILPTRNLDTRVTVNLLTSLPRPEAQTRITRSRRSASRHMSTPTRTTSGEPSRGP